jgi:NAD-dependent dihydropyrimidine dehydrogenase PreA subunit
VFIVSIDPDQCSGCNACADGCPAHLLKFNGEKTEVAGEETDCMGCESCITVCPTGAVSITEM